VATEMLLSPHFFHFFVMQSKFLPFNQYLRKKIKILTSLE
jgi:hypothetical protein